MRLYRYFSACTYVLTTLLSAAPERAAADVPAKPLTEISVVALGPKPGRKFKHNEGGEGPIMLLAKPGEVPPAQLYYRGASSGDKKTKGKKTKDKKSNWKSFSLSFNNPSAMRSVPPGKDLVLYRKLPKDGGYERYVTIPAGAEGSRRVFFLLTSTKGPTPWAKPPLVRKITLEASGTKGKQFILKNLSRFNVLHAFEKSVVSVAPMKTISYKRAKTGQLYRLAAQYGTQKKVIYNTAVRLNGDGHIQLYALYDANPRTNSGRSVGVFRTMIPARAKVPPSAPTPSPAPE